MAIACAAPTCTSRSTAACQYWCSVVRWSSRDLLNQCFKVFHVGLAPAAQFYRSPWGGLSFARVFQCSAVRLCDQVTVCGLPEVFHVSPVHLDRDRSRRYMYVRVVRSCQRSIGSVLTSSKRRHMACCCVCMQVNETGHTLRLNKLPSRSPASPSGALFNSRKYRRFFSEPTF